jgi:TatD DNase family protein
LKEFLTMLIDAHAHLDHYGDRLDAALDEIARQRILTISVAMDLPSYQIAQAAADRCAWVIPTFGVHPWTAPDYAGRLDDLAEVVAHSPMIGEIGLDYFWVEDTTRYAAQRAVCEYFLAAARDQHKIVNLHTKGAEDEILNLLRQYRVERAIVHWYSGPFDPLYNLIDYGAWFTVGVEVLRSAHIRTLARRIPADQLLVETDNPGGWEWLSGTPGMPGLLNDVVRTLAEVREVPTADLIETLRANFLRLIADDPHLADVRARVEAG